MSTRNTFEEDPVPADEMARRIQDTRALTLPWYLAVERTTTVGYAYATLWKPRSAYRYSTEVTVYVAAEYSGKGIGSALYRKLLPELEHRGFHTILAGIALPNLASVTLRALRVPKGRSSVASRF